MFCKSFSSLYMIIVLEVYNMIFVLVVYNMIIVLVYVVVYIMVIVYFIRRLNERYFSIIFDKGYDIWYFIDSLFYNIF